MAELLAIEKLTRRLRRGRGARAGLARRSPRASRSRCSAATAWARPRWSTRIVGVTRYRGGTIRLGGRDITRPARRPARACRRRLGAAGAQHLQVAHRRREPHRGGAAGPVDHRQGLRHVPAAAERRRNLGNQLSGGEQQMLAVGRALILNPRIILLDEPLEGLAPIIVEELLARAEAHHPRGGPVGDPGRAERQEDPRRHRPRRDHRARRHRARGRQRHARRRSRGAGKISRRHAQRARVAPTLTSS